MVCGKPLNKLDARVSKLFDETHSIHVSFIISRGKFHKS